MAFFTVTLRIKKAENGWPVVISPQYVIIEAHTHLINVNGFEKKFLNRVGLFLWAMR